MIETDVEIRDDQIEWVHRADLKGVGWRSMARLKPKPGHLELDLTALPTYEVWARWGVVTENSDGFIKIWEGSDADKLVFKVSFWSERTPVRIVERHSADPLEHAMQRLTALEHGMQRALFAVTDRLHQRLNHEEQVLRYARRERDASA